MRTLASEVLSTPSSIVLTSPCLRPTPYIAIITRELTDSIIVHCCILWASKFYSIGWYSQRWTSVHCSAKKEHKDNLKEQLTLPWVKATVHLVKCLKESFCWTRQGIYDCCKRSQFVMYSFLWYTVRNNSVKI